MDGRRFLHQLGFAEQIVVWAARNWLTGGGRWHKVEQECAAVFGMARGATICQALDSFLWVLNTSACRQVGLGRLCCDRVWPDELRLITILSHCQGAAESEAVAQLSDLLPPTAARVAVDFAGAVAEILQTSGYRLPDAPAAEPLAQDTNLHFVSMAVH